MISSHGGSSARGAGAAFDEPRRSRLLSPASHLVPPMSPLTTHRKSLTHTPFMRPTGRRSSLTVPGVSRPASTSLALADATVSRPRRRRLPASPTADFSGDCTQYSADVRDRLCRFMNTVDVPPGVSLSEELVYKHVDDLVTSDEIAGFAKIPDSVQQLLPESLHRQLHAPKAHHLPSMGVCSEFCSMWWSRDRSLFFWHWPSVSAEIYEISFDDQVVSVLFPDCKFHKSLCHCFPNVPEIEVVRSIEDQLRANNRVTGSDRSVNYIAAVVITKSYIIRVIVCGSYKLGVLDHVPLMYTKTPFDGFSLSAVDVFRRTGALYLADRHGGFYEYQCDVIKSAYVRINFCLGGRLEALNTNESSFLSRWTGLDRRNNIQHVGHVKKVLDVRSVVNRVSFSQSPFIKQIAVDQNTGRIYLLTTHSEIFIANIQPYVMTLENSNHDTFIKIMERELSVRKDAVITQELLFNSILDFIESSLWALPQLDPGSSPNARYRGGSSGGRNEARRQQLKQEMKDKLQVISVHVLSAESIMLVMSDGSRCYLNVSAKNKPWSHLALAGANEFANSMNARGQLSNRLFLRTVDSRIWRLLQEGPNRKPIFDIDLVFTMAHVKVPPPGLCDYSVIRRLAEGRVSPWPSDDHHLSVRHTRYSNRCGGLLMLEVASRAEPETAALLVLAPGPADDRGRVSLEFCQWIKCDSGGDANSPAYRGFNVAGCCDLPLNPDFARFEEGFDHASIIFSLHCRLSLSAVYALSSIRGGKRENAENSAMSVLAEALTAGVALESLEWSSASLAVAGPSLLCVLQPPPLAGLYAFSRMSQTGVLKTALGSLDRLVTSLLSELSLVVRVPAVTGVVAETPEAAVRLLQSQIGQQLPAMFKWASLASLHRTVLPHELRRNVGHDEIGETRSLFFVDYRDSSMDQLWHLLVSEFRREADSETTPGETAPRDSEMETTPRETETALRSTEPRLQMTLANMTPLGTTRFGRLSGIAGDGVSTAKKRDVVLTFKSALPSNDSVVTGRGMRVSRAASHTMDVAAKLIVLLPMLCGFCDVRGKTITSESSRIQAVLRCVSRILQPFCAAPMFELAGGLPANCATLGKQIDRPSPSNNVPVGEYQVDSSPPFRNGRKRRFCSEEVSTDLTDRTATGMQSKTRRLLQSPQRELTGFVSRFLTPEVVDSNLGSAESDRSTEAVSLDFKLKPRFSTAELTEGKESCEALLKALQFYERVLTASVPQEIRNKISDDIARMNEISLYLNSAKQLFSFFICVSQELQRCKSSSDNSTPEAYPVKSIEAPLFDGLAVNTFNDLLCEVFRSSSSEPSTLHRWLASPLPGGIVNFIPPIDLLSNAPQLFGHHYLLWQSSLEPLKCLALVLDKFEIERRVILNEHLFEISRREPEKVAALRQKHRIKPPSQRDLPRGDSINKTNVSYDVIAMLEFQWADWTSKASDKTLRDLKSCLPLPPFLDCVGQHLSVISMRHRDDGSDESKRELRDHILTCLMCLASMSQARLMEFNAMESLLELLFEIHAFDAFVVALAMWSHHLHRPSPTWRTTWSITAVAGAEADSIPILQPRCSRFLHDFLNRLLNVSRQTDDWLGRDIADLLVLQLTKRQLPALSNLWQLLSSSCSGKESVSPCLILANTDGAAVSAFVASFDNSRRFLEESIANETFLWIVSQGDAGSFPRPLAALNSPHLSKWLDRISLSASGTGLLGTQENTLWPETRASVSSVALAVCEYLFSHGDGPRAVEYSLKLLQETPKWLTLPMTSTRLVELSLDLRPTFLKEGSADELRATFPTETLSVKRRIVAPELAEEIRSLFNSRWITGMQDDWMVVAKWLACLRRIGPLPIDTKLALIKRIQAANLESSREFVPPTNQSPLEVRDIHKRAQIQNHLLNELLEFTSLLVSGDGDISSMLIEIILESNSTSGKEKKHTLSTDSARQTLINNLITFFTSVLHTLIPSQVVIAESIVDFITCLKGFAPFPASVLLECWQTISNQESRNRLVKKSLFKRFSGFESIDPTTMVTIVSIASTLKSRNVLCRRSQTLGYIEDSALRFWNVYADSQFIEVGVPKISSKWLETANVSSRDPPPNHLLPIALYLILDRILRCNYTSKNFQRNAPIFDASLKAYFSCNNSSHTEKLRCSELGGVSFMRVLPVEEGDGAHVQCTSVSLMSRLMEEQFEVIGALGCFSLDVGLRSWIWELVGLVRNPVTGARYANFKDLIDRDANMTVANLKCLFDWIEQAIISLEFIVERLLGISAVPVANPEHALLQRQLSSLIQWLDEELPMNTGMGTVQHLTLVEATHALGVCLHDLHSLIVWAATAFLPETTKRLTASHVVMLSEATTTDASRDSPYSTAEAKQSGDSKFNMELLDLEAKRKGWSDIARLLVDWSQRARAFHARTNVKEVLTRERRRGGWDGSATRLLQLLLTKISKRSSLIERDIVPGLVAFMNRNQQFLSAMISA
eukprot:Gregarina_sp_Poly_1__8537@NODE_504_length_7871_cov_66_711558_g403_i0_p1_GENE_NODE_504_length_7871_cov_66_711558_g403_i0NODE_504_length_7871_cov_66_711558_g403_i0_p1_ORF_typecomplete_len2459_score379_68Nucleoporin_N/PF08801_11/4_5e07_NODE_504_length_7871_cov_66_711558_g403_i03847760